MMSNPHIVGSLRALVRSLVLNGLLSASPALAQTAPHLTGIVTAEPAAGMLRGDLCLSGLPERRGHSFLLNRGLNVREVRVAGDPVAFEPSHEGTDAWDTVRYTVRDSTVATGFCVSYVGAYPVFRVADQERSVSDWKGRIAFDGRTVRAAEQTRFYPTAIDPASGGELSEVTYRVEVSCAGCASLYLNGSAPAPGPRATFSSMVPRPLLLYAGDFPFTTVEGAHFVGSTVTPADAVAVQKGMARIARLHADYLGVPFGDAPTFLTFASVSRARELGRTSWAFVTWPTVAMDGRVPFSTLLEDVDGRRVLASRMVSGMSHEMGHFYFGTRYAPRGPLRWFLLESTAEYLSLRALRALQGDSVYASLLRSHFQRAAQAGPVTPLDRVREAEAIDASYRYRYGPLLLVALEQYIGEQVLRRALAGLVTDPPTGEMDYAALRDRLRAAGAPDDALRRFQGECLHDRVETSCVARLPEVASARTALSPIP